MPRYRHKTSKNAVAHANLEAKVLELRTNGRTLQQISDECGLGGSGHAYNLLHAALAKIVLQPAENYRTMELTRLEARICDAIAILQTTEDERVKLAAISELRALSESLRKLLGLDAAAKFEVQTSNQAQTPEQIIADYRESGIPRDQWPEPVRELERQMQRALPIEAKAEGTP